VAHSQVRLSHFGVTLAQISRNDAPISMCVAHDITRMAHDIMKVAHDTQNDAPDKRDLSHRAPSFAPHGHQLAHLLELHATDTR
jgi:hypothetical protein